MDFILGILLGISIGFLWGVWRATQSFIERIIERPEEIREIMARVERAVQEDQRTESQTNDVGESNTVRAEFHQGVCYLYDSEDQFLAQGATATDAIQAAEQRFPGTKFSFRVNNQKESTQ